MNELEKLLDELLDDSFVMEGEFESLEKSEQKIKAMLEINDELQTIRRLLESPSICRQTREGLEKDVIRLIKKFNLVTGSKKNEGGQ